MTKRGYKALEMKKKIRRQKKIRGTKEGTKNDQLLREEESFKPFLERNQVGNASVHSKDVVPEKWRRIREGSVTSESAGLL